MPQRIRLPFSHSPPHVQAALKVLGIKGFPNRQSLQTTYRKLMKRHHPDKLTNGVATLRAINEARTKEINSAYRVLQAYFG